MFTWLENKKLLSNTSLASAVRVKCLLHIFIFSSSKINVSLKRAKAESQIGQSLSKTQPRGLKKDNFGGGSLYPQKGWPHLTATPTWHCVPRWRLRPHFWSLLQQQLSWLFQTLVKTLNKHKVSLL